MKLFGLNSIADELSWGMDSLSRSSMYTLKNGWISRGKIDGYDTDYYQITFPFSGNFTITVSNDSDNSTGISWSLGNINASVVDQYGVTQGNLTTSAYSNLDGKIDISWGGGYSTDYYIKLEGYADANYAINIKNTYFAPVGQTITGTGDDDNLFGGEGNDFIYGLSGNDFLLGSGGDDYIYGGDGDDTIEGGSGNDTMIGGDGAHDAVAYLHEGTGVLVNLSEGTATGAGIDSLIGIEWIYGSNYDDLLTGDENDNVLIGYGGNDIISAGTGNDIIDGRDGDDRINGGDGNDAVTFSSSTVGVDVDLALGTAIGNGSDLLIAIENVLGSHFADTLVGDGLANALVGYAGDDLINGGAGDDTITGGEGNDFVDGGVGVDVARYSGDEANYTLTKMADGARYLIVDNVGTDGTDTLTNIEMLSFSNSTYFMNNAPQAADDSAITDEDSSVTIAVLTNDSDSEEDALRINDVTQGQNGVVVINADSTITYTPLGNFTGIDSFTYTIIDAQDGENSATVMIEVLPINDLPSGAVVIDGELLQGEFLFADTSNLADIDGLSDFTYQWLRNGNIITDASTSSYLLTQADVESNITVKVNYTDDYGAEESLTSAATATISNVDDEASAALTVTGTAQEGGSLVARLTDVIDNDGVTTTAYQWQLNNEGSWQDIDGATNATYDIASDQSEVGHSIRVAATTTDELGGTTEFISAPSTISNINDLPTGTVTITGSTDEGATLSADATSISDEDGLGTLNYQWLRNGTAITDATTNSYVLTQDDVGSNIGVTVTYTDNFGAAEMLTSAATAEIGNVDNEATATLTVTGNAEENGNLVASLSDVVDNDGATIIAYQWQLDNDDTWQDIIGATSTNYSIASDQSEVGKKLRVIATTTDEFGGTTLFISESTAAVENVNDAPVVYDSLIDQQATENSAFSYHISQETFSDDDDEALSLSAELADGSALPEWLSFEPTTGNFSGHPENQDEGVISIRVTVTDSAGATAFDVFDLSVSPQGEDIQGDEANDVLFGTDGNDTINGYGGDDIIEPGAGNDIIDGGDGKDTIQIDKALSNFIIVPDGNNLVFTDKTTGGNIYTLIDVERAEFSDYVLNFSIQDKAAAIDESDLIRLEELYIAFFNRTPDADGLEFWIDALELGQSITEIAEQFYTAGVQYSEVTGYSPTMSSDDFIHTVYRNVLGREGADQGGLDFWNDALTSGTSSRGSLVDDILDAAHTYKDDQEWGWVVDLLENKAEVATKLAVEWGLNNKTPEEAISQGMAIAAEVSPDSIADAIALTGLALDSIDLGVIF